jgi:hypothetical protein
VVRETGLAESFPSAKEAGMDTASAGMTENEPAFQVWLRLSRARNLA